MLRSVVVIILIGYLLWQGGCASKDGEMIYFEGEVVYLDADGGFWGIVTDDGKQYEPLALPLEFRKEGLKVKGKLKLRKELYSPNMWGTVVEIIEIASVEERTF